MKEGLGRLVGTGLATACLAVPLASCSSSERTPSRTGVSTEQAGECYAPTPHDIRITEQMFSEQPLAQTDPKYQTKVAGVGSKRTTTNVEAVAAHFGLYVPPQSPETTVENDYFNKAPFTKLFKDTARYLGEYGVQLSIAQPDELDGGKVPTQSQLNTQTSSYEIVNIAKGFRDLPIQYIQYTGLKKVILAAGTKDAAYAETHGADDTVAVDVTNMDEDPQLLDHEMYHLMDFRECGGYNEMTHDPGYEAIAGDIYSHKKDKVTLDNSQINTLTNDLINEQNETSNHAACQQQAELDGLLRKTVAVSDYSLTNVVEDKAEMGKNLAIPYDYSRMLTPQTPIIKRKFEYLLARLYHFKPKVVDYLAAVSTRTWSGYYTIVKGC